jgi:hypothetical protein
MLDVTLYTALSSLTFPSLKTHSKVGQPKSRAHGSLLSMKQTLVSLSEAKWVNIHSVTSLPPGFLAR